MLTPIFFMLLLFLIDVIITYMLSFPTPTLDFLFRTPHSFPSNLQDLISPTVSMSINVALAEVPPAVEIRTVLQSMHNSKSSGPDGMNPLFYKRLWNVVGNDAIHAVQDFFQGGKITRAVNHTFFTLIPKWTAANKVN